MSTDSNKPSGGRGLSKGKRKSMRTPQLSLETNLGPVLDLSGTGIRIIAKKELRGLHDLVIEARGIQHAVRVRVIWSKKVAFRMYEVGLSFIDASEVRDLASWIAMWSPPRMTG